MQQISPRRQVRNVGTEEIPDIRKNCWSTEDIANIKNTKYWTNIQVIVFGRIRCHYTPSIL